MQNDPVLQLYQQQHLFRNDTAADSTLMRGGSNDTDQQGGGGSSDMQGMENMSEVGTSPFSRMQSGHLSRIDHNLWQVTPPMWQSGEMPLHAVALTLCVHGYD
jgi:hypothetical protein